MVKALLPSTKAMEHRGLGKRDQVALGTFLEEIFPKEEVLSDFA